MGTKWETDSTANRQRVRVIQHSPKRGKVDAHLAARAGRNRIVRVLFGVVVGLCARVNEVSAVLPADEDGCPLAEHPMGIQVRRYTVGQDEHQGEGTKEGEDKFP